MAARLTCIRAVGLANPAPAQFKMHVGLAVVVRANHGPSGLDRRLPKGCSVDPFEDGDSKGFFGACRHLPKPSGSGRFTAPESS